MHMHASVVGTGIPGARALGCVATDLGTVHRGSAIGSLVVETIYVLASLDLSVCTKSNVSLFPSEKRSVMLANINGYAVLTYTSAEDLKLQT